MTDQYLLIANQIRDIHHNLSEKIRKDPKKRPKWDIISAEGVFKGTPEEFAPLLILANLLDQLGGKADVSFDNRLQLLEKFLSEQVGEKHD